MTPLLLPTHSVVILTCNEKTLDRKRLRLEAEIIRSTSDGYAIEWTEFAPAGLKMLLQPLPRKADPGAAAPSADAEVRLEWHSARG